MEPQLENIVVKLASEASLVSVLPFLVHDLECNVFIWRASHDFQDAEVSSVSGWDKFELGCGTLFYQVRIENVELVSLNYFRRRVVKVVMSLIVFIPLKASVNSVEISWLPWPVFVTPLIALLQSTFNTEHSLIFIHSFSCFLFKSSFFSI